MKIKLHLQSLTKKLSPDLDTASNMNPERKCSNRNCFINPHISWLLIYMINQWIVGCIGSTPLRHQAGQNNYVFNDMTADKMEQLQIPKDQTLIVRLPSNALLKYTSYKDVSILHFRVPPDTRQAMFTFKATEESKSAFQRKCKPRDVTLHLKAGSYPVISPENITFPRNFLSADQRYRIYSSEFQSDGIQQRIKIDGPHIGNWFAVAFLSWTDPNNERIEQQGLAALCDTLLLAEMSVSRLEPIIVNHGQQQNNTLQMCSTNQRITENTHISPAINAGDLESITSNEIPTLQRKVSTQNASVNATAITSPTASNNNMTITATTKRSAIKTKLSLLDKAKSEYEISSSADVTHFELKSNTNTNNKTSSYTINASNCTAEQTEPSGILCSNSSCKKPRNNEIVYKFYVPLNVESVIARLKFHKVCLQCPDVVFHVQANAMPSTHHETPIKTTLTATTTTTTTTTTKRAAVAAAAAAAAAAAVAATATGATTPTTLDSDIHSYVHNAVIKPNQTDEITIEFFVQPQSWHYALLAFDMPFLTSNIIKPTEFSNTLIEYLFLNSRMDNQYHDYRFKRQLYDNKSPTEATLDAEIASNTYLLPFTFQIDFMEALQKPQTPSSGKSNAGNSTETKSHDRDEDDPWKPIRFRNMEFYPLLRQSFREFFMFDYDLLPDENGTVPAVLNLTAGVPAGFRFDLDEISDIGGTLSFAISMQLGAKCLTDAIKQTHQMSANNERNGILAEKLIGEPNGAANNGDFTTNTDTNAKTLPRSNQTIIVCMHLGEPGEPTWPDKCRYGREFLPASSIVNNTDANTSTGIVHVPFPESGQWYVTMGLYCHGAETASRVTIIESVKEFVKMYSYMLDSMRMPCACAIKSQRYQQCVQSPECLQAMNESESLKIKECLMDSKCTANYIEMTEKFEVHHKFATEQHFALENCNTSVVFTISSSPCVAGRCGRFGRCYHYMSGGFVFSTCVCMKGYRGWDCTEDSQVPSSMSIIMASLLLTLSNLLFFPSICLAMQKKYYSEAIIYFFAMFFSIFYHACDSGEDEFSFCLVKIGVLQFCDFYCGLLAIWVTLVAMSHIRQQFVSALHMLGAILLAFGTELNKQSLWVFLAPALTGICLISASWGLRCYRTHKCFPAKKYLTVYMPMGTVLVMVGLVCYAFLQTKQNYHIVHSIWHMVMALSILCLLPSRKTFTMKC